MPIHNQWKLDASPLKNLDGKKKLRAAKKEGRKAGSKAWEKEAGENQKRTGSVMRGAETASEVAAGERWMQRANKKYAKQLAKKHAKEAGKSKKETKADVKKANKVSNMQNKQARKEGAGKAYGKGSVNQRNRAESKRVWDADKAAKKQYKKTGSEADRKKFVKARAARTQNSKRVAERFRRKGSDN